MRLNIKNISNIKNFKITNALFKIFLTLLLSITIYVFINFQNDNISLANEQFNFTLDKNIIEINDDFNIDLQFINDSVASFTINIFFDNSKISYLENVENSNYIDNKIIYTWTVNDFNNLKTELSSLPAFSFKGLNNGSSIIYITGEFYDINGNMLNISDESHTILIGTASNEIEHNMETPISSEVQTENYNNSVSLDSSNSNLQVMRLSEEGISPTFSPDVYEYYLTTNQILNNIDITAIPENLNTTVNISGNTNLVNGLNIITIEVISEDTLSSSRYIINVTNTDNIDSSNVNLETLAIDGYLIYPNFDNMTTNYDVEVSSTTDFINILAIPELTTSTVSINNPTELKTGNNLIEISVTAPNKFTTKTFYLNVYRRNEFEENEYINQQKYQTEQLQTLLANSPVNYTIPIDTNDFSENSQDINNINPQSGSDISNDDVNSTSNSNNDTSQNYIFLLIYFILILFIVCTFILNKKNKNKSKNKSNYKNVDKSIDKNINKNMDKK